MAQPVRQRTSGGRTLWYVIGLGMLVHIGLLAAVAVRSGRIDGYAFASLDCGEYHQIARNVAWHGTFSQSPEEPLVPDTWRTPGYPLLLAGWMRLLGDSPMGFIIAQQALGVLNGALFFAIAGAWMSRRRALGATLLFLIEPYRLYYSLWLMSTSWFTTLLLGTWYCTQNAAKTRRIGWVAAAGICSGLLVLVWPLGVLVPAVIAIHLTLSLGSSWRLSSLELSASNESGGQLRHGNHQPRVDSCSIASIGASVAVFLASFGVTLAPWLIRNRMVGGSFSLSHQSGIVLAYFKGTEVSLWREGRTDDRYLETSLDPAKADLPHRHWDGIDRRLRQAMFGDPNAHQDRVHWKNLAQGNKSGLDSFVLSKELGRIGWADLTAAPLQTAACYASRIVENLTFPLSLAMKTYSGVLVSSRLRQAILGGAYALACAAVLIRFVRGRWSWRAVVLPCLLCAALLVVAAPQVDPRFRVPVMPMLILLAWLPVEARRNMPPKEPAADSRD